MIPKNIESTLIRQNPHWRKGGNDFKYVKRDLLERINLDSKFIEVIVGVRRGGKSTCFNILIDCLIKQKKAKAKEILFLNFDNPNFIPFYENVAGLDILIEQAEIVTGQKLNIYF